MSKKQNYTVKADGWVAGDWRARGSAVQLTERQAKYENVVLQKDETTQGDLTDTLDKSKTETAKRSRSKK